MAEKYSFRFIWNNPPRTTTKQQWKDIQRFLRDCRRLVAEEMHRQAVNNLTEYLMGIKHG